MGEEDLLRDLLTVVVAASRHVAARLLHGCSLSLSAGVSPSTDFSEVEMASIPKASPIDGRTLLLGAPGDAH